MILQLESFKKYNNTFILLSIITAIITICAIIMTNICIAVIQYSALLKHKLLTLNTGGNWPKNLN
jgi:hypothetical protein